MQLPWGMTLNTDINQQSRRGYSDASMNTNELVWNFQLSQRLLPRKNLTISLRAVDVLDERADVNRNISSTARVDTRTRNINSYYMLSVNYRFGRFGGRRPGGQANGGRGGQGNSPRGGQGARGGQGGSPRGGQGPRGGF